MKLALSACASLAAALFLVGCSSSDTESPSTTASSSSSSGGGDGGGGGGSSDPGAWQVVLDGNDLDRAVLSVWGAAPEDVYVVGGPLGNSGFETLAAHYDGQQFRELSPGGTETFWWVGGSGPTDVWMVGTAGRITHWDGQTFTEHASGTTATLWGVWAASPDDAWVVGGTPGGGTAEPNDLVLHWDGAAFTPVTLPGEPLGRSLFKVWGAAADDVYIAGESGTIWHKKGADWALESDPPIATGTLFTVNGCSSTDVYAVGTVDVLHSDGTTWSRDDTVELTNSLNGVACGADSEVLIVGFGGLKQRHVDGHWIDEFTSEPYKDLHGAWGDSEGSFWAVGGEFLSQAKPDVPREGIVARFGKGQVKGGLAP